MLRWMLPSLIALMAIDPAVAADSLVSTKRAARELPPGLPRTHYKYRTTVAPSAPRRVVVVVEDRDVLFTPSDGSVPYIPPMVRTPLLPGSSTIPGYYGRPGSFDYQGPYYGGPQVPYYNRLPYACGVYGYC